MLSPPHTERDTPTHCLELEATEWNEGGRGGSWRWGGSKKSSKGSSRKRRVPDGVEMLQSTPAELSPPSPLGTLAPPMSAPELEEHCMQVVKVILLGAPAVGKTSIIQQFVWNEFNDNYTPTIKKQTYYPTVILNNHIYEMKLSDIPVISYFPLDSFSEWADFKFYGLRSATAYVLVYDLSNAETFQYIRTLREQMAESRDMRNVPVLVVGNKQDLVVENNYSSSFNNNTASSAVCLMEQGMQKLTDYAREKREIVNFVKKHWKCGYVECSAKYNWKIMTLFKELTLAIDLLKSSGASSGIGGSSSKDPTFALPIDNFHGALHRNKCQIL